MNWASYLLSLCLHLAVFLLIMFWPSSPPVNLETPPVMISLVDGAPGGNRTPSSILGKMGKPTEVEALRAQLEDAEHAAKILLMEEQ